MSNKNLITKVLATAITLSVMAAPSFAASINKQQLNQQKRINHGILNGELTAKEAKKLSLQQRKIDRKEARFKSDGQFTPRERASIRKDLKRASAHIYRQKHDTQHRY